MSGETDLIKLYSPRILALATDIPRLGRLEAPDATCKKRSPLCGSTVTVDLTVQNGCVTDYAQDVKACALGQAAAAVVGGAIVGRSQKDVVAARDALKEMLTSDGAAPAAPFDELEILRPAGSFRNRHNSILLTLEAAVEALQMAQTVRSA